MTVESVSVLGLPLLSKPTTLALLLVEEVFANRTSR